MNEIPQTLDDYLELLENDDIALKLLGVDFRAPEYVARDGARLIKYPVGLDKTVGQASEDQLHGDIEADSVVIQPVPIEETPLAEEVNDSDA